MKTWSDEWQTDFNNKSTSSTKSRRLDNASRAGPGGEPENDLHGREPEVLSGNARELEIVPTNVENRPSLTKPLITPSPYDGKTSWDDYQVQFELIAELNGWNTSTMAIYLAASLSGCAQTVLTDLDANSRRNYKALRDALSLRFGNAGKMELFRSQLKSRIRGKDESLPELAQVIQRLVRQAYPEASLSVWEVLAKDHFVDAIADADIRWKVLKNKTQNGTGSPRHGHRSGGISDIGTSTSQIRPTDCEYCRPTGFRKTP